MDSVILPQTYIFAWSRKNLAGQGGGPQLDKNNAYEFVCSNKNLAGPSEGPWSGENRLGVCLSLEKY